jgi:hypothetical protein
MDVSIYRDKVYEQWGVQPCEAYAGSEIMVMCSQLWNRKGMTFYPDLNFLEFIPEDEHLKSRLDPAYEPHTVLLNEVQAGQKYELVVSNFLGGVFVRYRPGDLIKITSLQDEETGVELPQMVFYSRADELIDIAGFTRLTEKTLWQAIHDTGVTYTDWTAVKEEEDGKPVLRLYIELSHDEDLAELRTEIHQNLTQLDQDYASLDAILGLDPLRLTRLSPGAFDGYYVRQKEAGAELAHLKPSHISPSPESLKILLEASSEA